MVHDSRDDRLSQNSTDFNDCCRLQQQHSFLFARRLDLVAMHWSLSGRLSDVQSGYNGLNYMDRQTVWLYPLRRPTWLGHPQ